MSKIALELSKFKHVSSDNESTTLQHQDGHQLIIANKALSPTFREQLEALAKHKPQEKPQTQEPQKFAHGTVDTPIAQQSVQQPAEQPQAQAPVVAPAPPPQDVYQQAAAEGQQKMTLQKQADADATLNSANQQEESLKERMAFDASHGVSPEALKVKYERDLNRIQAQKLDATAASPLAPSNNPDQLAQADKQVPPSITANGTAPGAPQEEPKVPQLGDKEAAPAPQQGNFDPESRFHEGALETERGIYGKAAALDKVGQIQAKAHKDAIDNELIAKDAYQQSFNDLDKDRLDLQHDIKEGYVSPEKYWTGIKNPETGQVEGSHSKVMAGIGMILAGFNPTGQPNAAINFLKYQMDKNLEAQAQNLSSKQNLLAHNLQQFGNLRDATQMARIQMNDMVSHQLDQAAAQAQGPIAKAAAQEAAGQFKIQSAGMARTFAMQRAMMNLASGSNSNPGAIGQMIAQLRIYNPEAAKEMESRWVPGVGLAGIPVPEGVRQKLVDHEELKVQANDLLSWVEKHSTILPGTPDYNIGQQKALALQASVREGKLGTVYREGEQPLLDKFVNSNPAGALKMLKTIPQLKELLNSNERSNNALKRLYQIPVSQTESNPNEGKTGSLKDGSKVKMVDGKWVKI